MTLTPMRRPLGLFRNLLGRDWRDLLGPLTDEEMTVYRGGFVPAIDVFHDEDKVTIRAELPGVKRENLAVNVEGDVLTISGAKEHVESPNYHQIESQCGSFTRSVTLPHTVAREQIAAAYKDGVLVLTLPLKAEAKPRQIDVKID